MATKVTLRKKAISKGRETLYLDFYPPICHPETKKLKHHEHLGLYITSKPRTKEERQLNREILYQAEVMRGRRLIEIINEEFGFIDKQKNSRDFLEYFRKQALRNKGLWPAVYEHFNKFVGGRCTFGMLTVDLCSRFRNYLLTAEDIRKSGKIIGNNTAAGYFIVFLKTLKNARKDKILKEDMAASVDKIWLKEVRKEFLTMDELLQLANTPCKRPELKAAAIFSCLTGLRISDIRALTWENIVPAQEGGYCLGITMIKTGAVVMLPINDEALAICGERKTGLVFSGLTKAIVDNYLKDWLTAAGITKHITFHSFRHTYATLQISMGTDIFTVSKMLAHRHMKSTQIYANLANHKKREAAELLSIENIMLSIKQRIAEKTVKQESRNYQNASV